MTEAKPQKTPTPTAVSPEDLRARAETMHQRRDQLEGYL